MLTEPMIAAIAHTIDDRIDENIAEQVLCEALFGHQIPSKWESNGNGELRELRAADFKLPTKRDPSISKRGDILLPTFSDYDLAAIARGVWNILQRQGEVVVTGRPGFAFEGDTAPLVARTANVSINRAMEMHERADSIIISAVDDYPLSKLEAMDLPGPAGPREKVDDWLQEIIDVLDDLERRGVVDVDKYPAIPRSFGRYWAIEPHARSNAVMLFSKKYGYGFYVVSREIDGMDWDVAIQAFYEDPERYLGQVGISLEDMPAARRGRMRLLFRDYLRATDQGVYIDREGNLDDIVDFATGKQLQGIPAGVAEQILRPTWFV